MRPPKFSLGSGLHPFLAYTEAKTQNAPNNNFAEQTQYDKYAYPWSIPSVLAKRGIRPDLQQFLAYVAAKTQNAPNNNFAEQSYYDRYAYPWSEPVRKKPGLGAYLQHTLEFQPAPMNIIILRLMPWFVWLSNPSVMTKPMLGTGNQPVATISPYIPSFYPFDKGYVIE